MTPQTFIAKWGPGGPAYYLNEEQGAQSHFIDLCDLLGVHKPGSEDGYIFEKQTLVLGEARGYADVFKRGAFAWENKAPGKNLDAALKQLLNYSSALSNPPILVVCDRFQIRVQTQFTGHPTEKFTVLLHELADPEKLAKLRRIWLDPESFRPKVTSRDITESAAKNFAALAEQLRKDGHDPQKVSHFLTQCLFCFFAEDVGLLPDRMFEKLISFKLDAHTPYGQKLPTELVTDGLSNLFNIMRTGGLFGFHDMRKFNGGLFEKVDVPKLNIINVTELRKATTLNWSAIDVSIFGTLFERGLDPAKRSQLGAHYTDPATIMRIIEPVMQRPLLQIWELLAPDLIGLMAKSKRKYDVNYKLAHTKFADWLLQLRNYRVLDPACGSGNFLFMGLKTLKDIELKSHIEAAAMGLDREADLVTGPHNMLGIELNEYAAELARVTVWIGELQWRLTHGYEFKTNPVLEPLDNIECRDALLSFENPSPIYPLPSQNLLPLPLGEGRGEGSPLPNQLPPLPGEGGGGGTPLAVSNLNGKTAARAAGQVLGAHTLRFLKSRPGPAPLPGQLANSTSNLGPQKLVAVEATWPKASIVIGNPPFLGGNKKRGELGDTYFEALDTVFKGRVPGGADLVCYWFDKARAAIETKGLGAAGLVATQSIRSGSNRAVLDAIRIKTRIFDAWSDEAWVNEGAAVRVSLVSFGWGDCCYLNGQRVEQINAELGDSTDCDMSLAKPLPENAGIAFQGPVKVGAFDIEGALARKWLMQPNVNRQSNAVVLKPWVNGQDIAKRHSDTWIVDFGAAMDEHKAAEFELPFSYLQSQVKPQRLAQSDESRKRRWWLHGRSGEDYRAATSDVLRYIATPRVAKHRYFVWLAAQVWPDSRLYAIAKSDDITFGILSSRMHEAWSLANASMHGVGNDPTYNAKSCFETFPFPELTPDPANQAMVGLQIRKGEGATSKRPKAVERPSMSNLSTPPAPGQTTANNQRATAEQIAKAAKQLNDLRENWLNPPEWTDRIPEVTPLGMTSSPYPDRTLAKPGHEKDLAERTLTKLYNQRPAWLDAAHKTLDAAVAAAYNWADYTADMPNEEILKRLLALNLERAGEDKA